MLYWNVSNKNIFRYMPIWNNFIESDLNGIFFFWLINNFHKPFPLSFFCCFKIFCVFIISRILSFLSSRSTFLFSFSQWNLQMGYRENFGIKKSHISLSAFCICKWRCGFRVTCILKKSYFVSLNYDEKFMITFL